MACNNPQVSHESLLPSENGDKAKPVEAAMTPDSTGLMATPNTNPPHESLLPSPHPGLDPGSPVVVGDSCPSFRKGNLSQE